MKTQEAKTKLQAWLEQQGMSVKESASPADYYRILASDDEWKFELFQPQKQVDMLMVASAIGLDKLTASRLGAIGQEKRASLQWKLLYALIRSGVGFSALSLPFDQIIVTERIYLDSLTKDRLFRRMSNVRAAIQLITMTIQEGLGEPPGLSLPETVN